MRRASIGRTIAVLLSTTIVSFLVIDSAIACRFLMRYRHCEPAPVCTVACPTVPVCPPTPCPPVVHSFTYESVPADCCGDALGSPIYGEVTDSYEGPVTDHPSGTPTPAVDDDSVPTEVPEPDEDPMPEPADPEPPVVPEPDVPAELDEPSDDLDLVEPADDALEEMPGDDLPMDDLPGDDLPTDDLPTDDGLGDDLPMDDLPADDLPTDDLPSTPADDGFGDDDLGFGDDLGDGLPADDGLGDDGLGDALPGDELPTDDLPTDDLPADNLPADDLGADDDLGFGDDLGGDDLGGDDLGGEGLDDIGGDDFGGDLPTDDLPADDGFSDPEGDLPGFDDIDEIPEGDAPVDDIPGADEGDSLDDLFSGTDDALDSEPRTATLESDMPSDSVLEDETDELFDSLPAPTEEEVPADNLDDLDDLFGAKKPSEVTRPVSTPTTQPLPMRSWTDNTGLYKTMGRLVKISATHVRLLKDNGRFSTVPKHRLSEEDLNYVEQMTTVLGVVEELDEVVVR